MSQDTTARGGTPLHLMVVMVRRHAEQPPEASFFESLGRKFRLTTRLLGGGEPVALPSTAAGDMPDACLVFLPYRHLADSPTAIDWGPFPGLRVMYDPDASQQFHGLARTRFHGTWPEQFRRHGFDLLVATGKRTTEVLSEEGVPTRWVPKGFDPAYLHDLNLPRNGYGHYGTLYHSRRAMLDFLRRKSVDIDHFSVPHRDLNTALNRLHGCVVCNLEGVRRGGVFKLINYRSPSRAVRTAPGGEPMFKNFEVAGSGCAPVMDQMDEFDDLGFVEGQNYIGWSDFDELVDHLRWYAERPDELRRIGRAASVLAHERHTWDHRAEALDEVIRRALTGQ